MSDREESINAPSLPTSVSIAQLQLLNSKLGVQDLLSQLSSLYSYQSGVLWRQNNSRLNPRHASIFMMLCMQSSVTSTGSHLYCIWQFGLPTLLVWLFFNNVACFITEKSVPSSKNKIKLLESGKITRRPSSSKLNQSLACRTLWLIPSCVQGTRLTLAIFNVDLYC